MITTKLFEIRDVTTCIVVLATQISPQDDDPIGDLRMLGSRGYMRGSRYVIVTNLSTGEAHQDSYGWRDRVTMPLAHDYITTYWNRLPAGAMIDIGFIRGACDSLHEPELSTIAKSDQERHHFRPGNRE